MSRPLAWNGTAWVDPKFWTGTEWKQYIPPAYDRPMEWDMSSLADLPAGWYSNYNAAGEYLWGDNGSGGLVSAASCGVSRVDYFDVEGALGHNIRGEGVAQWVKTGGGESYLTVPDFSLEAKLDGWGTYTTTVKKNPNSGWGPTTFVTPTAPLASYYFGPRRRWSCQVYQATPDPAAPYIVGQIRLHSFRFVDLTAGTTLMALGDPGWQPKVRTTTGAWI